MKKVVRLFLVLFLVLSLNGCDDWDDWFGSSDSSNDTDTTNSATTTTSDTTTTTPATTTTTTTTSGSGTEYATYWGLTNGGLPTFYFSKPMSDYPTTFTITLVGCFDLNVVNDGHRWEGSGWIVKQSHVSGRGMAMIGSGCSATQAYVTY